MKNNTLRVFAASVALLAAAPLTAAEPTPADPPAKKTEKAAEQFDLTPAVKSGDVSQVTVKLEAGGELIVADTEGKEQRLPMSVAADLAYAEQIVHWSAAADERAVSLRRYKTADATLKSDKQGTRRTLPGDARDLTAVLAGEQFVVNRAAGETPLTREQVDLLDVTGNTLALDRLLPGRPLAVGDNWDHDPETLAALLGLDHVGVCEVNSVVTGVENSQVQLRLAGTVRGTVAGAATEIELRAAYLFHQKHGRITKFNLAVKENRKRGEVGPGLDVTAKLTLVVRPAAAEQTPFDAAAVTAAADADATAISRVLVDASRQGYRFQHSAGWFVTAEQAELLSLRLLRGGDLLAHCNVTTLPARSAENAATLDQYKADVKQSLGENIESIAASEEWITPQGNRCLAVFANGKVKEVPVQWRYYLISTDGLPQASVAVTIEQDRLDDFCDADRMLIDSLELLKPVPKTAVLPDRPMRH